MLEHSYLSAYLAWQYTWIYLQICSIYTGCPFNCVNFETCKIIRILQNGGAYIFQGKYIGGAYPKDEYIYLMS